MIVQPGTIHSLIGPNGAGKTTLFNVISRIIEPTSGEVQFNGENFNGLSADKVIYKGISRTFQNLQLFRNTTVYENIYSGLVYKYKGRELPFIPGAGKRFMDETRDRVLEVAEMLGIKDRLGSFPSSLPYGILKRVELARALVSNPKMLLLDEPAAGLNNDETREIDEVFHKLNSMGVTMLLVEHDMNMVMKVSHRITVMNFGEKVAEGTPKEIASNPKVIEVYLGKSDMGVGNGA
jgi:branched-chain amino acid transport system ATP-binding protein